MRTCPGRTSAETKVLAAKCLPGGPGVGGHDLRSRRRQLTERGRPGRSLHEILRVGRRAVCLAKSRSQLATSNSVDQVRRLGHAQCCPVPRCVDGPLDRETAGQATVPYARDAPTSVSMVAGVHNPTQILWPIATEAHAT